MDGKKSAHPLHDPAGYVALGQKLASSERGELALSLIARAMNADPGDSRVRALSRIISSHKVDGFHRGMLADEPRNAAYRAAIERLAPGKNVFDVGTGSGLLAMMAARAGAKSVVACEMNPMLAATAREIVAANGLSDQITIIGRNSAELDKDADLAGGADLVISEIVSDDLIGEGMLPALEDVRTRLCRPGAVFLPEGADIRVSLCELTGKRTPIGEVEGFDLSLFNRHVAPTRPVHNAHPKLKQIGETANLFTFEFHADAEIPQTGEAALALASGGEQANGIAQWIHLRLTDGISYENAPGPARALHWPVRFSPLAGTEDGPEMDRSEIEAKIEVGGWFGGHQLTVWHRN
ncbi:50S ribosomal protein L11 methyltransferase [Pontixanthobacter luteolus]|uniref:50S ribosomal protein L11 methyltransferase n=1 Tax=Pontixanthobacter luteolus TaxID=295089 RepID=UPI0023042444|nr:50S ribosomal protein L11 methyltransferase [Pontixanthobacter luteolus]